MSILENLMNSTKLTIPARRVAVVLSLIATFLAIQSIAFRALQYRMGTSNTYWIYQYGEMVNINREANIPTWFSATLLLIAALLLLTVALVRRVQQKPALAWTGLALIFTYISMDEAGTIHEKLTPIMQEQLNLTGYLYFGWVVVGVALVAIVALIFLPFVWRLPPATRRWFILAGMIYVGGAIVVESVSANIWYLGSGTSLRFSAVGTVEEWMEMMGVITLIYGVLDYIRSHVGAVQFSVSHPQQLAQMTEEPELSKNWSSSPL